jgi:HAD superfamily hydrolase (TIGR01509 family)
MPEKDDVMQVTAVLFDMGGTLFSYAARERIGRANDAALQRLGFGPAEPDVREARRRASEDVEREYATRRAFLHRDMFRDRIARTAELLGVIASADVLNQFDVDQRQAIIDHLVPMPDAVSTLRALRSRGLYIGVVSNADDDFLGAVLERHGIDKLVDDWTSSEEADSCKPDLQIYDYSLAKAGRTPPETLFVGDSPQHDVAGAARAGMRTVLIGEPGTVAPLSHGLDAAVADFEIRSLTETIAIVDDINGRE